MHIGPAFGSLYYWTDVDQRGRPARPVAGIRRVWCREAWCLEGELGIEVVDRPLLAYGPNGLDQLLLPLLG